MEYLSIIPATALGFLTLKATTHPQSRIRQKLPNIKTRRVQVFPVIRFYFFGRVIHLHHWINFSILLILSIFVTGNILDYVVTKGLLLGGIIQGLSLPGEHRKIVYKDFSIDRLTSTTPPLPRRRL
ncbi:hypothetical protein HYS96_03570 [Candidatus Daviesbacteria bacterium]|nr:hypothetical protein [Candidatus Daviesbacteria bacterium]